MFPVIFSLFLILIPVFSYSEEMLMICSGREYQYPDTSGKGIVVKGSINSALIDTANKTIKYRGHDGAVRSIEYTETAIHRKCSHTGRESAVTEELLINKLTDTLSVFIKHHNNKLYTFLGGCKYQPKTAD